MLAALLIALLVGALGVSSALLARERRRGRQTMVDIKELRDSMTQMVAHTVDTEERERKRIAQGIHDGPMQTLLVAYQDLEEVADGGEKVERVTKIVSEVIDEMRRVVSDLHPATMSHGDLAAALRTLAEQAGGLGRFEFTIRVEEEAREHNQRLVLSVARELLTNAAKHSRARNVMLTVGVRSGTLALRVVDDGVGISPDSADTASIQGHVGLASVSERLRAVGGTLELTRAPGGGTVATAAMPLDGNGVGPQDRKPAS